LAGEKIITSHIPVVPPSAPQVVLIVEDETGSERRIRCKRVVTLLGSRKGCKIRLNHPRVSGVQTAIVHTGKAIFAVDLVTRHGTELNELQMRLEELSDGDLLKIACWSFQVEIAAPEVDDRGAPFTDLDHTPEVVVLEHTTSGRLLKPHRSVCTLGRRNGCDIIVSDPAVSRVQALLFQYYGHPAIFDLLSENGIKINGTLTPFRLLRTDDIVTIGSEDFRVRLVAATGGDLRPSGNGQTVRPSAQVAPARREPDLIDIHETESSHDWAIVDHLNDAKKKHK
jgi:pSer/pThr/pTyr-binding forkhead associated (FHA) protein